MKFLLSGGGTIGSVSPLIAIFEEIKRHDPNAEVLWLETKNGAEHKLIASYNIPTKSISSGKFRRYFSFKNFVDPFFVLLGFFQSLLIILKFKPDLILSAGGFISVPVAWAGWILRKPVIIHQQDVRPGLANKLMAPTAKLITVTFKKSLTDFSAGKTKLIGNPIRADILTGSRERGYNFFQLDSARPTVLIIGGGTGAITLNKIVSESLDGLMNFCQVIHLTGGKVIEAKKYSNYRSYDFLTDQLKNAYAVADLVVSRAGMSVLSELAILGKPTIIIPIPNSHQQDNAVEFFKNNAALMIDESNLNARDFVAAIAEIINDKAQLSNLSDNIKKMMPVDAAKQIVEIIYQ